MNNPRCDIVNLCFGKKARRATEVAYRQYIEKVTSSRGPMRNGPRGCVFVHAGQERSQMTTMVTRSLASHRTRQPRPEAAAHLQNWTQVPEFHRAWNPRPQAPLRGPRCQGSAPAFARSIPPGVFAFHARGFHEHCNVHNADYGFAAAKKGSIVTSRPTSGDSGHLPQGVLRPRWELLFGEAGRIMS